MLNMQLLQVNYIACDKHYAYAMTQHVAIHTLTGSQNPSPMVTPFKLIFRCAEGFA